MSETKSALPDDVLHIICELAAKARDFDTLFNLTISARRLAVPALTNLYREHHHSPVKGGGSEAAPIAQQQLVVQKWSILWRSIIASSLEDTLYPYCRYIRMLDLRDLTQLLDDDKFKGNVSKNFFSNSMARFNIAMETPSVRETGRKLGKLNTTAILDAIGEVVTAHTPMLELISGKVLPSALLRWAPRLPRLRSFELYDGDTLADEDAQASLHANCPHFEALSMFSWGGQDRDHKLAAFLGGMSPQSFRSLEVIRDCGLSTETFLSLSNHCESLKELKISLGTDAFPHLGLLKGCTAVEVLKIDDADARTDLEATQNDVFLETVAWLSSCTKLRDLEFTNFLSGAALTLPVLLEDSIKLEKLSVNSYTAVDHRVFHQALVNQKESLKSLFLQGDGDDMVRDDVDTLVGALSQLHGLRELELRGVSDYFKDEHLSQILFEMQDLEDLFTTGLDLHDLILERVGALRSLKSVSFAAITYFTVEGLLDFVSKLGPENQSIVFSVDMADPDTRLSDDEQHLIREAFASTVGGRFEYTLFQDPDVPEYEGESD